MCKVLGSVSSVSGEGREEEGRQEGNELKTPSVSSENG